MKLLNRDTDYAARALVHIAGRRPETVPVSGMAAEIGVTGPFLRKILQTLNRARLLKSRKGRGGGFTLARAPEKIFLKDLMAVFQGPLKPGDCVFKKKLCQNHGTCLLRHKVAAIENGVLAELGKITLKDLMPGGLIISPGTVPFTGERSKR